MGRVDGAQFARFGDTRIEEISEELFSNLLMDSAPELPPDWPMDEANHSSPRSCAGELFAPSEESAADEMAVIPTKV